MVRELSLIAQAARRLTLSISKVYGKGDLTNRQCKACVVCVCITTSYSKGAYSNTHTYTHTTRRAARLMYSYGKGAIH